MPITSPWPTLEPYPKEPMASWLEAASRHHGERAALMDREGRAYTYRQTHSLARSIGRFLQDEGVAKGDRVAIVSPNSTSVVIAYLGILWAGGVALPLNPLFKERELKHFLGDSGARVAIVAGETLSNVQEVKRELPELEGIYTLEELLARAGEVPPEPRPLAIDPETDLALLTCTGGTSGLPKEAVHTHYGLAASLRQQAMLARGYYSLATFLISIPLYLPHGLNGLVLCSLFASATQIIMPRFDAEEVLHLIEKHRVTNMALGPTALATITDAAEGKAIPPRGSPGPGGAGMTGGRHDLSSLAVISCGGDTLVPELWERASQTLRCNIVQTYGSAEAFCINTSPPGRVKPGSVGPAVADTWEKIVALDTDEEVGLGEMGELLIRGPQVCKGYW
ncbi:MAG TPA: class I adenylate-forming enzyme family protein, partial [Dehalococcoidia bacterium]|nr:class I adenylate-forming enzyme family protein [Dehalococcoidia bacterium]